MSTYPGENHGEAEEGLVARYWCEGQTARFHVPIGRRWAFEQGSTGVWLTVYPADEEARAVAEACKSEAAQRSRELEAFRGGFKEGEERNQEANARAIEEAFDRGEEAGRAEASEVCRRDHKEAYDQGFEDARRSDPIAQAIQKATGRRRPFLQAFWRWITGQA